MRNRNTVLLLIATACAAVALVASGVYALGRYTTATLSGLAPGNATPTHYNPYQDTGNYIILLLTLAPALLTLLALALPPPPALRYAIPLGVLNVALTAIAATIVIIATLTSAHILNKHVDTLHHARVNSTQTPMTSSPVSQYTPIPVR